MAEASFNFREEVYYIYEGVIKKGTIIRIKHFKDYKEYSIDNNGLIVPPTDIFKTLDDAEKAYENRTEKHRIKIKNIECEVKHSETKDAWNILGTGLGRKFKIARIPYLFLEDDEFYKGKRQEALSHAEYIAWALNNSEQLLRLKGEK